MDTETIPPEPIPPCPGCHAAHVVRNGKLRSGAPSFLCRGCGRRFVAAPGKGPVSEERKALVRRLLLERLGLRAAGASRSSLRGFVNGRYRDEVPREPGPLEESRAG